MKTKTQPAVSVVLSILKWAILLSPLLLPVGAHADEIVPDHKDIISYTDSTTCIGCHGTRHHRDLMATSHWTWEHVDPVSGQVLGKKNVINNYCIATSSNEPRCTSCHIGTGWKDDSFDFKDRSKVDCLVCHDTTGTYKKPPTTAGAPDPALDLTLIARNAGKTSRKTCGVCHFYGGGADAVKHGDLDSTMTNPTRNVDVHMGTDGLNFSCAKCHSDNSTPDNHHDFHGSNYPSQTPDHMTCERCHTAAPHTDARLNTHTSKIACQTCHIPAYARGGKPTKATWDWSTAGNRLPDGKQRIVKDSEGNTIYDSMKGDFTWESNAVPEYRWFNGEVTYATLDTPVVAGERLTINQLHGSPSDSKARIYPVKRFTGKQPYDVGTSKLAVPHLFPTSPTDVAAYWKSYDWTQAAVAGQASVGRDFTGPVGWVETEMYWIQNHMVAPKEQALSCADCHSSNSRLDFAALGYPSEKVETLRNLHHTITSYTDSSQCATCHGMKEHEDIMATSHWTWNHVDPASGQALGKKNVINNFCIANSSNEPRCTSCHIGTGWKDNTFDFSDHSKVDCLVCHDTTGTYKKPPTAAGAPDPALDLAQIARNVGKTSRKTCGVCHFFGGGADAVKHGDLDSTMTNPTRSLDVHMGVDGANFNCSKCHTDETTPDNHHDFHGTRYPTTTPDHVLCQKCHGEEPHASGLRNRHTKRVSCQACHVPAYARGGKFNKMTWDWSTAGNRLPGGAQRVVKDAKGNTIYDSMKGDFSWSEDTVPEYRWFNGQVTYATLDSAVVPGQTLAINQLHGNVSDSTARLFPVKRFTGKQPYDAGTSKLAIPHLFPLNTTDAAAYWKSYDWNQSLAAGQASVGRTYSGTLGWVDTEMFWIENHMVSPKENALTCADCHSPGSRINFLALGYPAETAEALQNRYPNEVIAMEMVGPNEDVRITWSSNVNYFRYQVQGSEDLITWKDEPNGKFTGGAAPQSFVFEQPRDATSPPKKFYRVMRSTQ